MRLAANAAGQDGIPLRHPACARAPYRRPPVVTDDSPCWTMLRPLAPTQPPQRSAGYSLARHIVCGLQNTRYHSAEPEPYPGLPSGFAMIQRHSKAPGVWFIVASPLESQMAGAVFSSSVTRKSDTTNLSKSSRSRPAIWLGDIPCMSRCLRGKRARAPKFCSRQAVGNSTASPCTYRAPPRRARRCRAPPARRSRDSCAPPPAPASACRRRAPRAAPQGVGHSLKALGPGRRRRAGPTAPGRASRRGPRRRSPKGVPPQAVPARGRAWGRAATGTLALRQGRWLVPQASARARLRSRGRPPCGRSGRVMGNRGHQRRPCANNNYLC